MFSSDTDLLSKSLPSLSVGHLLKTKVDHSHFAEMDS